MKTVGIIGYGVVGKATEITLKTLYDENVPITKYDIKIGGSSIKDTANCDFIFICVPTPSNEDGSCNTDLVERIVKDLSELNTKGIVVIRSTVIPGTTSRLRSLYKLRLNFMPEFLTEARYEYDAQYPEMIVVGGPDFAEITDLFFRYKKGRTFESYSSTNAEMTKYAMNTFFTTKVIFANELYDICQEEQCNYDFIKSVMYHHPWVGGNHLDVFHGGFRGAGGKCLLKDTKAIASKYKTPLLQKVDEINTQFIRNYLILSKDS